MKTRSGRIAPGSSDKSGVPAVRGRSKSGAIEKTPRKRASTLVKGKKPGKDGSLKVREEKTRVKELSKSVKDEINGDFQAKLDREAAGKARKAEQAKKSEVVQQVKNASKLQKTKKKLLKRPSKASTTEVPDTKKPKRELRSGR